MKKVFTSFFVLTWFAFALMGQTHVINDFETYDQTDSVYWGFEVSDNADLALSFTKLSHSAEQVAVGDSSMKVEYSAHNSESWGGYAKFEHFNPDSDATYDFSLFDSISFRIYNASKASITNRVHLRFEMYDVSDAANGNATYDGAETEFYYSFQNALDMDPGWNEYKIGLTMDEAGGVLYDNMFHLNGWAGIKGNYTLDKDKIKGFAFEISVNGAGEGDAVSGTFYIDQIQLFSPGENPVIFFNGRDYAFDVTPGLWGNSAAEVVDGAGYTPETNAIKWTVSGEWSGYFMGLDKPRNLGYVWDTDSLHIKMKVPAGTGAFRIWFEDANDAVGKSYYSFDPAVWNWDGEWRVVSLPIAETFTTPDPFYADSSNIKNLVFMTEAGFSSAEIYFDDVWTGEVVIDVIPSDPPTNVSAVPQTTENYNLVIWADVPGESDESYDVYASSEPITDITAAGVYHVAYGVAGDVQSATHYLLSPGESVNLHWYYAVTCTDNFGNVSEPGLSPASYSNTAKAVGFVSLDVPDNVVVDGDLSEWTSSKVVPFVMDPNNFYITTAHVGGAIDDGDDLTGTLYMAVDSNYLYIAADVIDNEYVFAGGNWWEQDVVEVFIGLYEHPVNKHTSISRGAEPDYKFVFNENEMWLDVSGSSPIVNADTSNYFFEDLGGVDYTFEAKISLDSILIGKDARFYPEEGMMIPITMTFHDKDLLDGTSGNLGYSPLDKDNAWQTNHVWMHTWIGSESFVSVEEDNSNVATSFELKNNYPNPFNPSTTIAYSIPAASNVKIEVFNVLGQKVYTAVNAKQDAGNHKVTFNAKDLASGIYFYRLKAGNFSQVKKMMLMK